MKEYALSILMLTQLAIQWQSRREQGSLDTDHSQAVTDVFSAWIDILLKSQYFTCALTRVMLPIMDRYAFFHSISQLTFNPYNAEIFLKTMETKSFFSI